MALKKNKKSYWNYRVLTRIVTLEKDDENSHLYIGKKWREFFIAEVYYKDGKPTWHGAEKSLTSGWETMKDLKWTVKHLKEAFEKPVLDVDNWPKKFKE